jgi:DNA primase
MSDLQVIKKRLVKENKIEDILEAIGCSYITYSGGRIEAQLPEQFNSSNKRSVQVKLNEYLSSSIRTPIGFNTSDIFSLISFLYHDKRGEDIQKDLHEAKKFICETLGWNEYLKGGNFVAKKDYTAPLKAILKGKTKRREVKPNPILSEEIMDEFLPYPSYDWIEEGISYKTQKMYDVRFDLDSKRIVFPLRNRFGKLVGVKGRIIKDEDEPDTKYLYIYPCQNRYEWFNFYYAHPYILTEKKVFIFESEKSSMKAFDLGIYNTLAIGSSEISLEQAQIIKQLGLDIEIVLCYDKGIELDEIKKQAKNFEGRKVYSMFDTDNIISGKDSPIDGGIEIWDRMLKDYTFEI